MRILENKAAASVNFELFSHTATVHILGFSAYINYQKSQWACLS